VIGFSKGAVVLNQLLYDMHSCQLEDSALEAFYSTLCVMAWLDGGHSGGSHTWITDKDVLASLGRRSNLTVDIRVTPYQVRDPSRPWIGREESTFSTTLQTLMNERVKRRLYFADAEADLSHHFQVIDTLVSNPLNFALK
jgi:hypothetical protein